MGNQRIDQRAGPVARRRMNHQPGRLVDDDQRLILKNDIKRDGLAFRNCRFCGRDGDLEQRAGFDPEFGLNYRAPIVADMLRLDQRLEAGPAQFGQMPTLSLSLSPVTSDSVR